tara:strand:+ start:534 stop:932 length:399 start_codon:yes stop_codon:yes gene_type:complete
MTSPPICDECSICLSEIIPGSYRITNCGHYFHKNCLARWNNMGHNSCPNCRYIDPNIVLPDNNNNNNNNNNNLYNNIINNIRYNNNIINNNNINNINRIVNIIDNNNRINNIINNNNSTIYDISNNTIVNTN